MRILFTRFPLESAYGGAEIQTISLMRELRVRKHEVIFLGSCPVLLELCKKEGIPAAELQLGPPPVTKKDAITFFWRRKAMQKQLLTALGDMKDIDVVCMLSITEKLLATERAAELGKRVFWIEHDRIGRWLRKNPWLKMLRRLGLLSTTIAVSELSRKMYIELGFAPERMVAIPNGIDMARLGKADRKIRKADGVLHLGCVARLSKEKGIDVMIDAMNGLPNVVVDLVGQGPDQEHILALVKEAGLKEAHVATWTGTVLDASRVRHFPTVENLASFYVSHDAIVLPSSDHDPFGLTVAEAMSLGVPVLVTDACGIASYLHDGQDAVIVKANDAVALHEGMKRMQDAELRGKIAAAGKKLALSLFTIDRMTNAYEALMRGNTSALQVPERKPQTARRGTKGKKPRR